MLNVYFQCKLFMEAPVSFVFIDDEIRRKTKNFYMQHYTFSEVNGQMKQGGRE